MTHFMFFNACAVKGEEMEKNTVQEKKIATIEKDKTKDEKSKDARCLISTQLKTVEERLCWKCLMNWSSA